MFDHIHHHNCHVPAICPSCAPLRAFLDGNGEALLNAAGLLGGPRGVALARSVLDGLSGDITPIRKLRRDLASLLDLLTLEHVHDEDRPEAALFAALHPGDPVVDDVCLLTEALQSAIEEWGALHRREDVALLDERAAA